MPPAVSSSPAEGAAQAPGTATEHTFRLPRLAYLAVLFLLFCVSPLAFTASAGEGARAVFGPRLALLALPFAAACYIARTATMVGPDGVTVRALFGRRTVPWQQIRGVAIHRNTVYVVLTDGGAVRMPCVRVADLAEVSRASAGRLPTVADPVAKFPPSRRKRR